VKWEYVERGVHVMEMYIVKIWVKEICVMENIYGKICRGKYMKENTYRKIGKGNT
jgi:hypothetical protein